MTVDSTGEPGVPSRRHLRRPRPLRGRAARGVRPGVDGGRHRRPRWPQPGAYLSVWVAGFPLVVVNDAGTLRAFQNVCRHRAGPLVDEASGTCGRFVCRYHGWAYALDGRLTSARDFGAEVDPSRFSLTPASVATWRGLLFVAVDPAEPDLGGLAGSRRPPQRPLPHGDVRGHPPIEPRHGGQLEGLRGKLPGGLPHPPRPPRSPPTDRQLPLRGRGRRPGDRAPGPDPGRRRDRGGVAVAVPGAGPQPLPVRASAWRATGRSDPPPPGWSTRSASLPGTPAAEVGGVRGQLGGHPRRGPGHLRGGPAQPGVRARPSRAC